MPTEVLLAADQKQMEAGRGLTENARVRDPSSDQSLMGRWRAVSARASIYTAYAHMVPT